MNRVKPEARLAKRAQQPRGVRRGARDPQSGGVGGKLGFLRRPTLPAAVLLVLATVAAYSNTFENPFIFDDHSAILANRTIRSLWPIWQTLAPPQGAKGVTVSGRPLLNLSFALNYAISGVQVWSYHLTNLAIHVFAALLLFGILRRTFLLPRWPEGWAAAATRLALTGALLWAVHPLQTESVTYIVQRAESLVGLFYLLTLYSVIRGATSDSPGPWNCAAVMACLLGTFSKEVMVTAPVVVLLYDRTFLSGSFRHALAVRRRLYLGLAATWSAAVIVMFLSGFYENTPTLMAKDFTRWSYLMTQPGVLLRYLRLAFCPTGLCFDYAWPPARTLGEIVPAGLLMAGLLGLTGWMLLKREPGGFLSASFFLILAPTSTIFVLDAACERRMYLPLAAVAAGVVAGGYRLGRRWVDRGVVSLRAARITCTILVALAVSTLAALTFHRNRAYHDAVSIWEDVVLKMPGNARAHVDLGTALFAAGRTEDAIAHFRQAIKLRPNFVEAHNNLGLALATRGQIEEAIVEYRQALALDARDAGAHINLGNALAKLKRDNQAIAEFHRAIKCNRDYAEAYVALGVVLANRGQEVEAVAQYRQALSLDPEHAMAHYNLGNALRKLNRLDEAIDEYRAALRINPRLAEAQYGLAATLSTRGRSADAILEYQKVVALKPDWVEARADLANLLLDTGRVEEAIAQFEALLRLNPNYAPAHYGLGAALSDAGRFDEAVAHYRTAVALKPDYADAYYNLAAALAAAGHFPEAIRDYRQVLRLQPQSADACNNLARLLAACPLASVRNGPEAVALASRAVQLSGGREPMFLDTLAAAYAEAGRFSQALRIARQAADLAAGQDKAAVTESIRAKIPLYQAGTPYRGK